MMYRRFFPGIFILPLLAFWFSCAGSGTPVSGADTAVRETSPGDGSAEETAPWDAAENFAQNESQGAAVVSPSELVFLPGQFPSLEAAYGVGLITRDTKDRGASLSEKERSLLSGYYRTAYVDSLLRGEPVAGVLGGDFVHSWPAGNPSGWVQNWRCAEPADNSWGSPYLILAIQGYWTNVETTRNRVFTVHGSILDYYGKSAGINRANGSAGYGAPRGYEFIYEGNLAQRFERGLIIADAGGKGSFHPGDPPSAAAVPPSETGVFTKPPGSSGMSQDDLRSAFLTAWKMALDRGIKNLNPDGPGTYLPLSGSSWDFPGGDTVKGLYIQSFNRKSILLVLVDSSLLPPYPRFISSPFLDVLLSPSKYHPMGGENLKPLNIQYGGGNDFFGNFVKGLALYGIPLTDPMPVKGSKSSQSPWQEAQRFSRGWLVGPPAEFE